VVLVIGNGLGQPSGEAPSLIGLSLDDATTKLSGDSLSIGTVEYDEVPNGNESDYVIYRQQPSAGSPVSDGATIDVWLTTDKGKLKQQTETEEKKADKKKEKDEDFF
jgi:beta-lactam-binding protein with PASTA domain